MSEGGTATALPLPLPEPEPELELAPAPAPQPRAQQSVLRAAPRPGPGEMTIDWQEFSPAEWASLLARVPRPTLEQAHPYAEAMKWTRLLEPRRGVIEIGETPVGIVQLSERRLWRFHVVVLERGPLWFEANPPVLWWRTFIDKLATTYPPRFGHLRFFVPELAASDTNRRLIETSGFRVADLTAPPERAIRLDLKTGEAERYRTLRADWRHHLQSSSRANLKVQIETTPASLRWLLSRRAEAGRASAAPHLSRGFIAALARAHFAEGTGHLYKAVAPSGPMAGALILGHGRSATYLFGWSSQEGRACGALHFLMWRAMQDLEERYETLDLGSFNSTTPEDVIAFKRGLPGEAYELLPMFR